MKSQWKEWRIGYVYPVRVSNQELIAKFTVKARNEKEAFNKAYPLMEGRGVAWRVYLPLKETVP